MMTADNEPGRTTGFKADNTCTGVRGLGVWV